MAANEERFRLPTWPEQFADGLGVRVPCAIEQDEDGFWCAHTQVRQGAAFGDGLTREAALDDLRAGLAALLSVVGPHS